MQTCMGKNTGLIRGQPQSYMETTVEIQEWTCEELGVFKVNSIFVLISYLSPNIMSQNTPGSTPGSQV